jgi:predicted phosphohydrolase
VKVFAIGDLHLSLARPKEMDVFGKHWENHWARISGDWNARVGEEDIVLIPGDISWAMRLEEALPDLDAIGAMPGRKVLLRGNHDYWWSSPAKIRNVLREGTYLVQNDSVVIGDFVFCGSRGWTLPVDSSFTPKDEKIYAREKQRLRMSLESAAKTGKRTIGMLHYPPLFEDYRDTDFAELFAEFGAEQVVFGHLHGDILRSVRLTDVVDNGTVYNLVSADYLDFKLKQVASAT